MNIGKTRIKRDVTKLGTFGTSMCTLEDLKRADAASETILTQAALSSFAQQAPRPLN